MSDRIVWFDLPTINLDRAMEFYAAVLDCSVTKEQSKDGSISVLSHKDGEIAGCLFQNKDYPPSENGVLLYFNVDGRLKNAVTQAVTLGGSIVQDIHAISPYGYRAIIIDSEGNRIALHSYH